MRWFQMTHSLLAKEAGPGKLNLLADGDCAGLNAAYIQPHPISLDRNRGGHLPRPLIEKHRVCTYIRRFGRVMRRGVICVSPGVN